MAAIYSDVDRLILERWDEVSELIDAREELEDRITDVIEAAGERVRRALQPMGYEVEIDSKGANIDAYRTSWNDRRRGPWVYFRLSGCCPRGYRRHEDAHPAVFLHTDTLENFRIKADERRRLATSLRQALGEAAREWDDDDCSDEDAPLGRYLTEIDNKARCELVSSPEKLAGGAVAEFQKAFVIADVVEACVGKVVQR
ncbi:MAG: hypothetical protein R2712_12395 [Vicinamibacterales bacterium]